MLSNENRLLRDSIQYDVFMGHSWYVLDVLDLKSIKSVVMKAICRLKKYKYCVNLCFLRLLVLKRAASSSSLGNPVCLSSNGSILFTMLTA